MPFFIPWGSCRVAREGGAGVLAPFLLEMAMPETSETAVPDLTPWVATHDNIDVESAAAALEGIDALAAFGVELIAPETLTRRKPTTRATATPNANASSGRFAATAIVQWQVVLDDTAVSDEALNKQPHRVSAPGSDDRHVQHVRAECEQPAI